MFVTCLLKVIVGDSDSGVGDSDSRVGDSGCYWVLITVINESY